jgi:hypothetical protein
MLNQQQRLLVNTTLVLPEQQTQCLLRVAQLSDKPLEPIKKQLEQAEKQLNWLKN